MARWGWEGAFATGARVLAPGSPWFLSLTTWGWHRQKFTTWGWHRQKSLGFSPGGRGMPGVSQSVPSLWHRPFQMSSSRIPWGAGASPWDTYHHHSLRLPLARGSPPRVGSPRSVTPPSTRTTACQRLTRCQVGALRTGSAMPGPGGCGRVRARVEKVAGLSTRMNLLTQGSCLERGEPSSPRGTTAETGRPPVHRAGGGALQWLGDVQGHTTVRAPEPMPFAQFLMLLWCLMQWPTGASCWDEDGQTCPWRGPSAGHCFLGGLATRCLPPTPLSLSASYEIYCHEEVAM